MYGIYTLLGDSISEEAISLSEFCLTKFVIKMEELYGLESCKFNVHCLTHLAHCVKDCGPLWATSTFTFEAHNHNLVNMFHGTQYVPQQITGTFLLKSKASLMVRTYANVNDSSMDVFSRLMGDARYMVPLDANWLVALQNLGMTVHGEVEDFYQRFVNDHQLYSSVNYTRSKRHTNHHVSFRHPVYTYGIILGLLNFKPSCSCFLQVSQYCKCSFKSVVILI